MPEESRAESGELKTNFALTLLCRLFLLAARQSVQAPSALAPQRRFCILHFALKKANG